MENPIIKVLIEGEENKNDLSYKELKNTGFEHLEQGIPIKKFSEAMK